MTWLSKLLQKLFSIREHSDGDIVKPFLDHLEDLRVMLFKMIFTVVIGSIVAFCFHGRIVDLLRAPLAAEHIPLNLTTFQLMEGFMISLKLSFYTGIVVAFPFLLYFFAGFVLPALTRREKRLMIPGSMAGFALFILGVIASYKFILPKTIRFFYQYNNSMDLTQMLRAQDYFSLVANLSLATGLLAELPVLVLALSALGIIDFRLLSTTRPYAVTIILIVVALIAPSPDPLTFLTMAAPVVAIYEICIWIVWLVDRRRANGTRS